MCGLDDMCCITCLLSQCANMKNSKLTVYNFHSVSFFLVRLFPTEEVISEAREVCSFICWDFFPASTIIWVPGHNSVQLMSLTVCISLQRWSRLQISFLWRLMNSTQFSLVPGHNSVRSNHI